MTIRILLADDQALVRSGIEATRLITAGPATARVLILTTFDEDEHVYGELRAGASGFVVKDMALDDILLGARDRVQLVITAYEAGLVTVPR